MAEVTEDHDQLVAYVRGELQQADRHVLEARLWKEPALREELERTRRVLEIVDAASDEKVTRWVNALIAEAVAAGASDIHFDLTPDGGRVRLRIDGVLHEQEPLPPEAARAALTRFRHLFAMDAAGGQWPESGRHRVAVGEREYVLRGTFLPSVPGGSLCARILDRDDSLPTPEQMGLFDVERSAIDRLVHAPCGLLAVAGPIGCGKTTMLYHLVKSVNSPQVSVMSVEDPVELDLPGVVQMAVRDHPALGFAALLRAILLHDPDVIMVGELHDAETVTVCCHSALTGHLVLTQLHAHDATSAVERLIEFCGDRYLVAETLLGVIGMRLVRRICEACRRPAAPAAAAAARLGLDPTRVTTFEGAGCEVCRQTGYHRRVALFEVLEVTAAMREAIRSGSPEPLLRELAFAGDLPDLRRHGAELVRQGVTTVAEVNRVLQA